MRRGRLAGEYDRLLASSQRGEAAEAHASLMAVMGLRARRIPSAVPTQGPRRGSPMLRYTEPRPIDLIALTHGARRVAKFEDLSLPDASRLGARLAARGLRVKTAGPYAKRFDVTVAGPAADAALYAVIASHGNEANEVAEAERDRTSDGTRRAGLALGYPACCVEHFVRVERSAAASSEGINEVALRSPGGFDAMLPWEMNPLSVHAPVGFTPCRASCPEALAFARRVLDAVRARGDEKYALVRRALSRPILFFRYPLFHVLEPAPGPAQSGEVRYVGAVASVEQGVAPALLAWYEDEVGVALAAGDGVRLEAGSLEILRGDVSIARWSVAEPRVPLLLQFRDEDRQ